ncbi:hypothetical protein [Bacillus marasmi]|uniref:hypothetical protein n=1 Tax=Bacillus marasmi TaxID=1926279 RepID=UPI0011C77F38|nr:hypothetical protein [Bacillus marasmi]
MRTQAMSIKDFMSGGYRERDRAKKERFHDKLDKIGKLGAGLALPLAFGSPIGAVLGASRAFAASPEAIPATATAAIGEKSLEIIAHALDPVVELLVAISFPIASIIIVGACFFFMFGMNDRGWSVMMNCGLGYVLIQLSPLILNILKQVGNAI